ncbi:hypothetical protein G7046_g5458 [Stylonectria norvegica]|nr:hypothetical protein G7046_g5458 [Stylonectria norvegica]
MVRDWSRDSFPHRHQQYPPDRYIPEIIEDGRLTEVQDMHRRQPPMQIDEALRQHCSISAKRYFLAVIMDDGSPMTFSGPDTTARFHGDIMSQFFDMEKYQRVMARLDQGSTLTADDGFGYDGNGSTYRTSMEFPRNRMMDRRRIPAFDEWDGLGRQGRKRPRARHPVDEEDDAPITVSTTRKGIKIGNSTDVWNFYEQRFKSCQQTACKLIAKAWVKAVEPKKQSTHPYTGSDEKAPDWWPKPWGPTKEDKVRHKEPDHLYKRERVHLLNHILRMIVVPNKTQHPDIQKLNLNVKKLEDITTEALSAFFTDKENPANSRKRPYLDEIFRVAKQEERFMNGEIDGTTELYVMAEDKASETYASENDDGSIEKEDAEAEMSPARPIAAQNLLPSSPTTDQGSGTGLHGAPFLDNLPVRNTQYAPAMMQEMAPEQHTFVEGHGMPVNDQNPVHGAAGNLTLDMGVPSPHDASRRPSLYNTPADYTGQSGPAMYTQQWQQPGSTAPHTSSMYTFTQQQANPSTASYVSPGVPMNQNQHYMGNSFDGLSRGYDPNHAAMFRPGGVPQPVLHPPQGYNYVPHDGRGLPGVKVDPVPRNTMH